MNLHKFIYSTYYRGKGFTAPFLLLCSFISLTSLLLPACRRVNDVVYSETYDIGSLGWDPSRPYCFNPYPADSTLAPGDRFDLLLNLRHTAAMRLAELPIAVRIETNDATLLLDTLRLNMRQPNGRFAGRKELTVYELSDTLLRSVELRPGLAVELRPLLPASATRNVVSVGITMTQTN